jgi:predicted amidophosphoribosyltransferase
VAVPRCPECRPSLEAARQAVAYAGPAPALVRALKDDRRRDLAAVLARVVLARCPPPPPGAALVPVPLGRSRGRARGFNQSALVARALGEAWRLPVADGLLVRVREEPPQRGASRGARGRQAAGAFAVREGARAPAEPWLVDDVLTTGATLAACAAALRRGGARRVGAVTFARVVRAASAAGLPATGVRQ